MLALPPTISMIDWPMARTDSIEVREFCASDGPQLLELMRKLAQFEGYLDQFEVTVESLVQNGLGPEATFNAFVAAIDAAEGEATLLGMAVTYVVPWTFSLTPNLVLKELFVTSDARGRGVGRMLFAAVIEQARQIGAGRIRWTVLANNESAKKFYRSFGARADPEWENWELDAQGYRRLASNLRHSRSVSLGEEI